MLMFLCAVRVSLLAVQATGALTLMSPGSLPVLLVAIETLVVPKFDWSVVAPMPLSVCPAVPSEMMKLVGSINQVPAWPVTAAVVTLTTSAILTCAALVSINPPLPPWGALASSVPATWTVPAAMPASKVMVPARFSTVCASMTPVLFTTLASTASLAPALISTRPPLALIKLPFSARAFNMLWSTCIFTKLLPLKLNVTALPAPSATVPSGAAMLPRLLTV